jgi:cleavage and polyadenylation specificity factor subunit 1
MAFEIQRQDDAGAAGTSEKGPGILAEQKKISRNFVPFLTAIPAQGTAQTTLTTYSGVFFTGDRPNWIVGGDKTGVQIYPSGHGVVHAFTACSLWDSRGDFLLYTEEVGTFAALLCAL